MPEQDEEGNFYLSPRDLAGKILYEQDRADKKQVGGSHYKDMLVQPVEYITQNNIPFIEGCVIKYVSRHKQKGGEKDIDKAIHFLELLKEYEYNQ